MHHVQWLYILKIKPAEFHYLMIYFCFFTEDIEWFKPVELRTKWGRRGHIREPLGKFKAKYALNSSVTKCVVQGGARSCCNRGLLNNYM